MTKPNQLSFRLGELDLVLAPALTYTDMKKLRDFGEIARKDHWAAIDLVIELFWKCAHAGDASVTREQIEDNVIMPDGVQTMLLGLLQIGNPISNQRVM
jgi:hypothetical protein